MHVLCGIPREYYDEAMKPVEEVNISSDRAVLIFQHSTLDEQVIPLSSVTVHQTALPYQDDGCIYFPCDCENKVFKGNSWECPACGCKGVDNE